MELNPDRDPLHSERAWLERLARRLGPGADDLSQELWLSLHGAQPRVLRSWLRRAAWHLFQRHRLRDEARLRREQRVALREALPPTVDAVIDAEQHARLRRELERLEEPYRGVVRERYFAARSSAEIARRRGVAAGTVRWQLKVGLDRLRQRLCSPARTEAPEGAGRGRRSARAIAPITGPGGPATAWLLTGPARAAASLCIALALGPRPLDPAGPGACSPDGIAPHPWTPPAPNHRPLVDLPTRDASLQLEGLRWLRLRDRSGAALPHHRLDIVHGEHLELARSDAEGLVLVRGLRPSSSLLVEGAAPRTGAEVLRLGPDHGELVVDRGPRPSVLVLEASGRPIPRAAVWLDQVCLGVTDLDGRLRVDRLRGQRLQVRKAGWRMQGAELDGALPLRLTSGMMQVVLAPAPAQPGVPPDGSSSGRAPRPEPPDGDGP